MLRRRIIAAATATVLALGMSVGGAGAALANPNANTPRVATSSGVETYTGNGLTCKDFVGVTQGNIDVSAGSVTGPNASQGGSWGTFSWASGVVTWNLNPGWTLDICIKGATTVVWLDDRSGSGSYDFEGIIDRGISHLSFMDARYTPPQPTDVAGSVTPSPENCLGQDGSLSFAGDTGVVFTFQGETFLPGDSVTGLAAGDYTVAVATSGPSFTLTSPSSVTVTVGSTQVDCPVEPEPVAGSVSSTPENCVDNNGSIVFGGDEGVSYTLDGETYFPGDSVTGLAAGSYTVAVAAVSGAFTLTTPSSIEVTVESTQVDCPVEPEPVAGSVSSTPENCVDNNGSIVFGGDEGVSYTLDGETYFPGDSVTGLAAGSYTVAVAAVSGAFTLTTPSSIEVTVESTQEDCVEPFFGATVAAGGECEADVPWIKIAFSIDPGDLGLNSDGAFLEFRKAGFTSEFANFDGPNATVWKIVDGERVVVPNGLITEGGDYEARLLWPGASIDSEGNATGWPGWAFTAEAGWFETAESENARWTRGVGVDPEVELFLSVNPITQIDVMDAEFTYPPATIDCATAPTAVEPSVEVDYTCELGGTIELSDTPGVIWTVNGVQTDLRQFSGLSLTAQPVISASLDPEVPGLFFAANAITELTVEFEEPEFICDFDLPERPIVTASVTSTDATCTTLGTYTLASDLPGVAWFVNGQATAAGTYTAATGSTLQIEARTLLNFGFDDAQQTRWALTFPAPAAVCAADLPTLSLEETDLPTLSLEETDLPTLALTGASGMLGTVGIIALLITLTGIGAVVARRRVEA